MVFGAGPVRVPSHGRAETVLWKVTPNQEEVSA